MKSFLRKSKIYGSGFSQKEKEINNIRQKEHLTTEMNAMLDSAYSESNATG